jgi:hypothetical protein
MPIGKITLTPGRQVLLDPDAPYDRATLIPKAMPLPQSSNTTRPVRTIRTVPVVGHTRAMLEIIHPYERAAATFFVSMTEEETRAMANALLPFADKDAVRRAAGVVPQPGWEIRYPLEGSELIFRAAYHHEKQELVVEFQTSASTAKGGIYRYLEVKPTLWETFTRTMALGGSAGRFYNDFVKGKHPSIKIDAFPVA